MQIGAFKPGFPFCNTPIVQLFGPSHIPQFPVPRLPTPSHPFPPDQCGLFGILSLHSITAAGLATQPRPGTWAHFADRTHYFTWSRRHKSHLDDALLSRLNTVLSVLPGFRTLRQHSRVVPFHSCRFPVRPFH